MTTPRYVLEALSRPHILTIIRHEFYETDEKLTLSVFDKGADPENKVSSRAKRHAQDHRATPEEQRLAEALKVVRITGLEWLLTYLANGSLELACRRGCWWN